MARAKRTARAEARRRYRAAVEGAQAAEQASDAPEESASDRPIRSAPRSASQPQRPSITEAFRTSFRPLDLRGDLRALPRLLLSRAFLAPTVASGLAYIAFVLNQDNVLALQFWQYFSGQFPVAAIFIGGFFAPRASWLIGILIAVASILFQIELFARAYPEYVGILLIQSVFFGALFASAAAWYRRFLRRANPNAAARQASASSRRPDGKIARKPQQRPMLARRR